MNDYILINSLLEDGSEASILKLKMIDVDFSRFAFHEIKLENIEMFKNNFNNQYNQIMFDIIEDVKFYFKIGKKTPTDKEFINKIITNNELDNLYCFV